MSTCPKCGAQASPNSKFCEVCGSAIEQAPVMEQPVAAPVQEPVAPQWEQPAPFAEEVLVEDAPKKKKKLPLLPIILGGVAVLLVAVFAILLLTGVISFGKKEQSYALYIKDGEMYYNSLKNNSKSWQVTSKLFDSDEFSDSEIASSSSYLGYTTYLSDNGKYIFYFDKYTDSGATLYYREVGNDKAEPVKIDSDIDGIYFVNEAATLVTYSKGEDSDLYQYNVKKDEKEKIASDVDTFIASKDGKTIIFMNDEDSIYVKVAGKDKEKIASEVSSIEYLTEDLKTLYYLKEGDLYKQVIGKDKEKIASDIHEVLKVYATGEIYYTVGETKDVPLMNYVDDDLKASDAAMVQPEYPSSPSYPSRPYSWNFDNYEDYEAAYNAYQTEYDRLSNEYSQAVDAYYTASDAWYAKQNRDSMRESLKEMTIKQSNYSLYYFDGKEEKVITDDIYYSEYGYTSYSTAKDAAVLYFQVSKAADVKSVKMSAIDSIYSVQSMVSEAMNSDVEKRIAVKADATILDAEKEITNIRLDPAGTAVYYIDEVEDEKDFGVLYRMSISNGSLSKAEVYDDDVYNGYISILKNGKVVYYKEATYVEPEDQENNYYGFHKGDLYVDKTCVDSDVYMGSTTYDETAGLIYRTDYNMEKSYGTLKVYKFGKNAKATKVADEVYSYTILPDGRILYLTDYSLKNYKGELNEWSSGKSRKLDDDVSAVIAVITIMDLYDLYF